LGRFGVAAFGAGWYDGVVSDFWTKERDPKGWTVLAGGVFYALFALVGLWLCLSSSGDYAVIGRKMQIGPAGGFFISAITIGALSWLLMLGLRSIYQRKSVGWTALGLLTVSGLIGSPDDLVKHTTADIWFRVVFSLVAGTFLTFAIGWLDKPRHPKTND